MFRAHLLETVGFSSCEELGATTGTGSAKVFGTGEGLGRAGLVFIK